MAEFKRCGSETENEYLLPPQAILRRPRSCYQRPAAFTAQESARITGRRFDDRHVAFPFEIFWRNVFQLAENSDPSIRSSMIRPVELRDFSANTAFFSRKCRPAESEIPYRRKATPGAGGRIGWF